MGNEIEKIQESNKVELSVEIIKRYICPSATDQEAYMFLRLCKAQNLNPFLREAYLIKYGTSPATIVTGKETFTKRADKLPQYDGFKAGIIVLSGEKIHYREGSFYTSSETLLGGWAEVYRKDRTIPFRNEVKLEEYIGRKSDGTPNKMWAEKAATMIRKVPLMQSLREAFPDCFGGLYSPEEINTVDNLPTYEIGKAPIIQVPEKIKMPKSKSDINEEINENNKETNLVVKTITGISNITQTKGTNKKTGQEYCLYKIIGNENIAYSTFDTKFATLAKSAKDAGLEIEIIHKNDTYKTIESINILDEEKTIEVDKELLDIGKEIEKCQN